MIFDGLRNFRGGFEHPKPPPRYAIGPDTYPAYLTSNLQQPKNETTNVVINIIVVSS